MGIPKLKGFDCMSNNPAIEKFVQEQIDQLLKSLRMHELVERIAHQEEIPKEKAVKIIMDKFAAQAHELTNSRFTITLVK